VYSINTILSMCSPYGKFLSYVTGSQVSLSLPLIFTIIHSLNIKRQNLKLEKDIWIKNYDMNIDRCCLLILYISARENWTFQLAIGLAMGTGRGRRLLSPSPNPSPIPVPASIPSGDYFSPSIPAPNGERGSKPGFGEKKKVL